VGRDIERARACVSTLNQFRDVRRSFDGDVLTAEQLDEYLAFNDADLLAICAPVHAHAGYIACALRHRKHVLVEKPFIDIAQPHDESLRLAETLAREALQQRLALVTNCQRRTLLPYIRSYFPWPESFRDLSLEFRIRSPRRKVSPAPVLLSSLISHALSMMNALGVQPRLDTLAFSIVEEPRSTCVTAHGSAVAGVREVAFRIVLAQDAGSDVTDMVLGADALRVRATVTAGADGRMQTLLQDADRESAESFVCPDPLSLLVGETLELVGAGDVGRLARSVAETMAVFRTQAQFERLFAGYIANRTNA
jgi:hypothetical protein